MASVRKLIVATGQSQVASVGLPSDARLTYHAQAPLPALSVTHRASASAGTLHGPDVLTIAIRTDQGFEALRQLLGTCPASNSYTVLIGCRDPDRAQAAYSALRPCIDSRHFVLTHELDLRRLASVRAFAARARDDIERTAARKLDILLLCAGISKAASAAQESESVWSEAYRVNCIGGSRRVSLSFSCASSLSLR